MAARRRQGRARPVAVHTAGLRGRFVDAGYARAFEVVVADAGSCSPEQWLRTVFEQAPRPLRWMLLLGWKLVLGLRLGPLDSPAFVLGWRISRSSADSVDLQVESRLLTAHKVLLQDGTRLVLATFLYFERPWSRLVWRIVAPVHLLTEPYLLGRAQRPRSGAADTSGVG